MLITIEIHDPTNCETLLKRQIGRFTLIVDISRDTAFLQTGRSAEADVSELVKHHADSKNGRNAANGENARDSENAADS